MKNFESKIHYKMYKSHKGWIIAGITATSMMAGIIMGPQAMQTARADDSALAPEKVVEEQPVGDSSAKSLREEQATSETDGKVASPTPAAPEVPTGQPNTGNQDHAAGRPIDGNQGNSEQSGNKSTQQKPTGDTDEGVEGVKNVDGPKDTVKGDPSSANIKTGIMVQNPDDLTDKVTGQPVFNVKKTGQLQYTYDHVDSTGRSSDLRVVDGYDYLHQVPGQQTWLGETYANNIAQNAKGVDMVSSAKYGVKIMYIDEWMPNSALQYFIWQNNFDKKYATFADFLDNFTKAELATVTSISSSESKQSVNGDGVRCTSYYLALISMKTLEGLQNATNLQQIYLMIDPIVSLNTFGQSFQPGNLWDIRALSNLDQLQSVNISMFSINDISALANKSQLTSVEMPYNQISDISPLATDKRLNIQKVALHHQHITLRPIKVNNKVGKGQSTTTGDTLTYTTPSFIIKDLEAANLPIKGFDNAKNVLYPSLFPSSADAGNVNSNTLSWYNLLTSTNENYGSLSTTWSDPNSSFAGYIIQPYELAANVGDLNVNIQLLQTDGQQLNLAPTTLISGDVGTNVNVLANATVMTFLQQQLAKGFTFSGLILDGTGLYSDWVAGNGKATAQPGWTTTLADVSKTWTVLFYKDGLPWNIAVNYGTKDADGKFKPITDETGKPVTGSYNGPSTAQVALNSYQKDFPDYIYTGAETSVDGKTWTDISQSPNISFAGTKQIIRMVYANAKRATVTIKDATTGKTIRTLDYKTNPELRGAIGTTSTFDADSAIKSDVAKGYKLVSDTTKNPDGTSAIVFGKDANTPLNFTITLAHNFKTTEKTVTEKITYQDQQHKQVATPVTKTMTFATVTDQVTQDAVMYSNAAVTGTPELGVTGRPIDTSWTVYKVGARVSFAAVKNPTVAGMHVVATTDPANDLTQTKAQVVTLDSADVAVAVTYSSDATIGGGDNGGGHVTPPTTGPVTGGDGDQIVSEEKPSKKTKKPSNKTKTPAKVTVSKAKGGQGAKVQQLRTPAKQSQKQPDKLAQSKTELPQTNEQRRSKLAITGLALLGSLVGLAGWKKRER
ncbi:mucin-binding protein [Levilactobacillus fuyuanensis]|uniref:LPXTG cell wall anchor domain-containing protein n=1 Tax=Levilactobacillus fuyuanensis TaxID=2486022 RepID=A0ABW4H2W9_9LACO|nr:LPXTG cell wall anchor domain-containing protein [Levilactobacillus fuyuanensis]